MSPHAYPEDQLVEQPAIGLFLQEVHLCKGCLHHSPICPTACWIIGAAAVIPRLTRDRHNELSDGKEFFDAKVPQAAALFPAEQQTSPPSIEEIERALAGDSGADQP